MYSSRLYRRFEFELLSLLDTAEEREREVRKVEEIEDVYDLLVDLYHELRKLL